MRYGSLKANPIRVGIWGIASDKMEEIGSIESLLRMLGGRRLVYAAGPYAALAPQ
jgi:hypothetical protein